MGRAAIPLLVAPSLSLALFGCGGDGGSGTAATMQSASRDDAPQTSAQKPGREGQGGALFDPSSLPEPVEGSKRAAPGVPVSEGGDNSIQTWGTEASASEREEVTRILRAFYEARAAGDWAKACTYLAAAQEAEFAGFIKGRSGNAACAEAMRGLASQVPASAFDKETRIDYVLSLRVGEGNAFLIYTRPGERKVFANGFAEEGGEWKVISVGPTVIY